MADQAPFPVHALPEPMRSYITEGAEAIGCDAAFVAVPTLAGMAGVIGNARALRLKRTWLVPCVVWAAVIAESGSAKSPAQRVALDGVRLIERRLRLEHADAGRRAAELDDTEQREPDPCQRVVVGDSTTEALAMLLQQNPRGLLMACDELSGWLARFDRYSGGKGGGDRAQWLELFDADAMAIDRKTAGSVYVPRAAVSLCGGIQPGVLSRVMGKTDKESGLLARLLLCRPPTTALHWTDADVPECTERRMRAAMAALYDLQPETGDDGEPMPRELRLSNDAQTAFEEYHNGLAHWLEATTGDLRACMSKLKGYLPRLAMVHHLARWAGGQAGCGDAPADADTIQPVSVDAAAELVTWFADEAKAIYGTTLEDDDSEERQDHEWDVAREVLEAAGPTGITKRELMLRKRATFERAARAERVLEEMVSAGAVLRHRIPPQSTNKGGRPKTVYILQPEA